jgi:hypothetical protein
MDAAAVSRTEKEDREEDIDQQDIFRFCRKLLELFLNKNPPFAVQKVQKLNFWGRELWGASPLGL